MPDPPPLPAGCYRDKTGALKRQAARFRIYGVNAAGEIVRELSGEGTSAKIIWHVELANAKAAWYGFQLALDIPEAVSAPATTLRNSGVADRSKLSILPGLRSVTGANAKPELFDSGAFMDRKIYLGEISTDAAARLLVLGGRGVSASHDGSPAKDFANNDGWFDDTSDGPVNADVSLDGEALDVTPAWVVVAPPNYGPRRKSVRTMWDLMRDVAVKTNALPLPERPSFTQDILPILQRLAGLQWVNAGFAAGFGWQGVFDLTSPEALARLSSAAPEHAQERQTISNAFRRFDVELVVAEAMAVDVRRRHEHSGGANTPAERGAERSATVHACAMGERKVRSRLRSEPSAATGYRGRPGEAAGRRSDPGCARILPRRCISSRL